jgi:hypothetical protein
MRSLPRCPAVVGVEQQRAPNGDYYIWVNHDTSTGSALSAAQAKATAT